jgi:hypothetical protein
LLIEQTPRVTNYIRNDRPRWTSPLLRPLIVGAASF